MRAALCSDGTPQRISRASSNSRGRTPGSSGGPRTSYVITTAVLLLLCFSGAPALAQMTWPLTGHLSPPDGKVTVTVDVLIDSVEQIDANANLWTGFVWFHMQWSDDRAADAIARATSEWAANAVGSSFNNVTGCNTPCDSTGHPAGGCCDGVYMPHIELPNVVGLNQEAVYKWRVWLEPSPNSTGPLNVVHRTALVSATFRSPYDFRAWPFEHQHLLIEMQAPPSQADRMALVVNTAKQLTDTPHTKGAIMPGWHTVSITKRVYDMSSCYNATNMTTSLWNISADGTQVVFQPLLPSGWMQLRVPTDPDMKYTYILKDECQQPLVMNSDTMEGLAGYAPQVLVVDIMIKRDLSFYVLAHVVPQILLAYLVFTIYAMNRDDLEARMGVVVTLTLAISALQFTWSFPASNTLNAVQQIMLMTYILYFVVAIESMIASHICRMHSRKKQHDALVQLTHDPTMPRGAGIATHNSTGSLNALGASAHWRPSAPGGDAMAVAAARAVADVDGSAPPEGKGGQQLVVMGLPPPSVAAARDSAHSMRRGLGGGGGASALVVVPPQQLQLVDAGGSDTAVVVPGGGVVLTPAVRGAATGATTSQSPLLPPAAQAAAAASAGSLGSSELDVTLDVLPSPGGGARGSALPRSGPITAGQQHPQQQQREMGRSVSGARRHNVPEGAVEASALLTTAAPGGGAGPLAEALESCFKRSAGAKEAPDSPTASAVKPLNVSAEKQQRAASGSGAALGEPSPVGGAAAGGVNTPFAGAGGSTHRWTGFMGMGVRRNVSQLGRTMSVHMSAAAAATRSLPSRIEKDEAFALLFASRMDQIFCWSLLTVFSVVLAVLLWVNTQVGDHKLMLSGMSRPANMARSSGS